MGITGNKNLAVEFLSQKIDFTLTGSKAVITFYTIRGQIVLYITLRRADKTEFVTNVVMNVVVTICARHCRYGSLR